MKAEISEETAAAEEPSSPAPIMAIWFLAIGCFWIWLLLNSHSKHLGLLILCVTAFAGGLILVRLKHPLIALAFMVIVTLAPQVLLPRFLNGTIIDRVPGDMSVAINIESAVMNFKTEYGAPPIAVERVLTSGPEGVAFLSVLLGNEPEFHDRRNPKGIRFLTAKETKDRKGGLKYLAKGDGVEGLFDSWGNPYVVIVNTKNEGGLRFNHGSETVELPGRSVAVFSTGKDGVAGNSDDVRTWGN